MLLFPNLAHSHVQIARRAMVVVSALIGALFSLAVITLFVIAGQENRHQMEHSESDARRALDANLDLLARAVKDYAFWNDAYTHVGHPRIDLAWAYDGDNIGPSLYLNYSLEGVFIVAPDTATRYAIVGGHLSEVQARDFLGGELAPLLALARQQSANELPGYGFYTVNGQPAIVYAAVIKPTELPGKVKPESLPYLVFVDVLDTVKLNHWEQNYGLQNLKVDLSGATDSRPSLVVQGATGGALRLRWAAENPGDKFLHSVLPVLAVTALAFAILMAWIYRSGLAAAGMIDDSKARLALSEERFRAVAEACSDWIWETDRDGRLVYLSERFDVITGFAREDWLGRTLCELLTFDWKAFNRMALEPGAAGSRKLESSHLDSLGRQRWCSLSARVVRSGDRISGYRGTVSDVTAETEARAHIKHLSQHDALTGLANRSYLHGYLQKHLQAGSRSDNPLLLLSLDLDRFKPINDTLGHAAGDQVLCEVARRLRSAVRDSDLVARLGGDEFVIVGTDLPLGFDVERFCSRLCEAVAQPLLVEGHEVSVGVSIGVVLSPHDGAQASDLLRYADIALYEAKGAGRNNWQFYAAEMNQRVLERRRVETDLRQALRGDQLFLEYQPRFDLQGNQLAAAEALVRWRHPERGLLPPGQFIAVAEESGLIVAVSDWVLNTACREAMSWREPLMVSVNLSSVEFQRGDLVARVEAALQASGLPPGRLELEITESVLLNDANQALLTMQRLKAVGVRLAMDDFGTGYSSLSYLRAYPFDALKIDRSFISDLGGSASSHAIIQAIIDLGKALTLTVTAEGIETDAQREALVMIGCEQGQGYLLGRPMPAERFRALFEGAGCMV
ncbi:bifunctional diguanylate cyclase/phosphodiesterase [Pseudomonas japonica]|uniref:bifunctional diguanylate cyclase/phosphodiesterase n=1 Tax=Pseudomonas japonica TaxID=256466 RepID=UPI0015E4858A|nr:EAL domain-containing protein [Pseudomonas japonica]MBA1244326.1 EAL domain-containing protein [Pseudomonas japonica]